MVREAIGLSAFTEYGTQSLLGLVPRLLTASGKHLDVAEDITTHVLRLHVSKQQHDALSLWKDGLIDPTELQS